MSITDDQVLDGLTCTIHLAGQDYVFKSPGNRVRREMLADAADIAETANSGAGGALRAINATMDFLAKWHEKIEKHKQAIEEEATEAELGEALAKLLPWLQYPLVKRARAAQEDAARPEESPTHTD